ncbi:hypothetical protein [Acidiferrobacter sp.]|uniref:hypothetical protein n=1 Tax=Acidiferrobacter sp. TaxID=1872107 RepID=UPI00260515B2|nr:hypothetical protein [Acidiferrobacter sp.]
MALIVFLGADSAFATSAAATPSAPFSRINAILLSDTLQQQYGQGLRSINHTD